jgi:hypothetical protein
MTMYKPVFSVAAAAAILGVVAMPAQAVSTFGFSTTGTVTYSPGPPASTVDLATSITVGPPPAGFIYQSNGAASGGFSGLPIGTPIGLSGNTFQTGTGVDFTMTAFGDTFTFTSVAATASLAGGTNNGATANNSWSEFGTLTDSLGFEGPGVAGELSLSAIQNLTPFSNNPNASWVFSSDTFVPPPSSGVPEPGSVAMLCGLGLSGASFMIRRRRK